MMVDILLLLFSVIDLKQRFSKKTEIKLISLLADIYVQKMCFLCSGLDRSSSGIFIYGLIFHKTLMEYTYSENQKTLE